MNWQKVFYKQFSGYFKILNIYLKNNYSESKLGDYIKILGGYAFKSSEYKSKGIPVIRISDFQNEEISLANVKFYNENSTLTKYELFPNDIIIAMTGGTIGKLAIVQDGLGKLYLNQRVGKFQILDKSIFEQEFIYWIARGVEGQVKNLAWGGAQPNVSSKQIENMPFYCPEKMIQRKIVEFFNDLKLNQLSENVYFDRECEQKIFNLHTVGMSIYNLNDEIETQQYILNKLKQSILQDAIQGKLTVQWRNENPDVEPASILLEKITAEKEQLVKEKKIKKSKPLPDITDDEIPFEIPNSWEWCRLGGIMNLVTDGAHHTPTYTSSGVYFLSVKDVAHGIIDLTNTKYISKEEHRKLSERCNPEFGDLLLTKVGTTGIAKVVNINQEFSLFVSVALLKFNQELLFNYYLENLINSTFVKQQSASGTKGMGNKNLVIKTINNFLIPIPPVEEQKEIVTKIEQLIGMCTALEEQINNSKQNTQTLMQSVLKEAFEK